MDTEKLEQGLKHYFQAEVEKAELSNEWWQRFISQAATHPQKSRQFVGTIVTKTKTGVNKALSALHINYRASLFQVSAYAALAVLFVSLTVVTFNLATANTTQFGQFVPTGKTSITLQITGLEQGEEATLRIGTGAWSQAVQDTLLEYQIQGTGSDLTKSITPDLEDGSYLIELEVPGKYTEGVKAYSFAVDDSLILIPADKMLSFELRAQSGEPGVMPPIITVSSAPPTGLISPAEKPQSMILPSAFALASLVATAMLIKTLIRRRTNMS